MIELLNAISEDYVGSQDLKSEATKTSPGTCTFYPYTNSTGVQPKSDLIEVLKSNKISGNLSYELFEAFLSLLFLLICSETFGQAY